MQCNNGVSSLSLKTHDSELTTFSVRASPSRTSYRACCLLRQAQQDMVADLLL